MGTLNQDLTGIKAIEDKINANKVATFAYTETAYQDPLHYADGVMVYDVNNPQNIPVGSPEALRVNETILAKGWRSQASSISRMLMNHFLGRCSYNLNQVNDQLGNLLSTLISHLGNANGIATLDANGRIPFSQLPESAMEFKGTWNAQTNTPQLVNGSGTNGDFYVCNVAGTVNFGAEDITFLVNDRAIYNGSVWSKLSAGDIRSVDGFSPDPATGNVTLKPAFTAESAPADNLVSGSTLPTLFGRIAGWINNFVAHRNNTSNPHSVTKSQVGLGSVVNTGDSEITSDGGATKFTTGGARKLLTSIAPYFSTATTYHSGDLVTYQNRLWKCIATHTGTWNDAHFLTISLIEGLVGKYVPSTRTINNKALSSNITLTKADIGLGLVPNRGLTFTPYYSKLDESLYFLGSRALFSYARNHIKPTGYMLAQQITYTSSVSNIVDIEKVVKSSTEAYYLVLTTTGLYKVTDIYDLSTATELLFRSGSYYDRISGGHKIVNAHYDGILYIPTSSGLCYSHDYGSTWTLCSSYSTDNWIDVSVVPIELIDDTCKLNVVGIVGSEGASYNRAVYSTNGGESFSSYSSSYKFVGAVFQSRGYAIFATDNYGSAWLVRLSDGNSWSLSPTPYGIAQDYPCLLGSTKMLLPYKRRTTDVENSFTISLTGLEQQSKAKLKHGNHTWLALHPDGVNIYKLKGSAWTVVASAIQYPFSFDGTTNAIVGLEYCRKGFWIAWTASADFAISVDDGETWSILDCAYSGSDYVPAQVFGVKDLRDDIYAINAMLVFTDTGVFEILSEDYWNGIYE